ncbi:uncharacterized protein LOC144373655 [Ictidomys tridecemlineatus]
MPTSVLFQSVAATTPPGTRWLLESSALERRGKGLVMDKRRSPDGRNPPRAGCERPVTHDWQLKALGAKEPVTLDPAGAGPGAAARARGGGGGQGGQGARVRAGTPVARSGDARRPRVRARGGCPGAAPPRRGAAVGGGGSASRPGAQEPPPPPPPPLANMADLEAVLADVSYLMAMEKSKATPAARASKKIVLPEPSIRNVMQKYLEERNEITFDKIFNQRIGNKWFWGLDRG